MVLVLLLLFVMVEAANKQTNNTTAPAARQMCLKGEGEGARLALDRGRDLLLDTGHAKESGETTPAGGAKTGFAQRDLIRSDSIPAQYSSARAQERHSRQRSGSADDEELKLRSTAAAAAWLRRAQQQ